MRVWYQLYVGGEPKGSADYIDVEAESLLVAEFRKAVKVESCLHVGAQFIEVYANDARGADAQLSGIISQQTAPLEVAP
jgi:hypothetical protein